MTIEQLQKEVRAISKAIAKIRKSGISDRALMLLIQASAGTVGSKKVSMKLVRAIVLGIENLEDFITEDSV